MSNEKLSYFLSRIEVKTSLADSAYKAHQLIWCAFGLTEESKGQTQPFRFRKESGNRDICVYLIQSATKPNWDKVNVIDAKTKSVQFDIAEGDTFEFKVKCPVYQNTRHAETGRRVELSLTHPKDIEAWFENRSQACGFTPIEVRFALGDQEEIDLPAKNDGRVRSKFKLNVVTFNGRLSVNNAVNFISATQNGFGPKQSMGMGLFSLIPD